MSNLPHSRKFIRFAKVVVFFALLLIWWGAATTTKKAGMVFADWPLSLGSVNPTGWLKHMAPFLEHSHRLLATLVGVLVLILFSWSYVKSAKRLLEVIGVVLLLAVVFGVFIAAGAERVDPDRKSQLFGVATGLSALPLAWLVGGWFRPWNRVQRLSALALILVTAQAILGGLRVTEISNFFAVLHGCLAQFFFCLLIFIVMVASRGDQLGFKDQPCYSAFARWSSVFLVALVSVQLILGASMRHYHREGLADTGLFKTQGMWIPSFESPIITVMFFHKCVAYVLFFYWLSITLRLHFGPRARHAGLKMRRFATTLMGMMLAQVGLGLVVIHTGKHFWLTNFHVTNGLAILAVAFIFAVRCAASQPALSRS